MGRGRRTRPQRRRLAGTGGRLRRAASDKIKRSVFIVSLGGEIGIPNCQFDLAVGRLCSAMHVAFTGPPFWSALELEACDRSGELAAFDFEFEDGVLGLTKLTSGNLPFAAYILGLSKEARGRQQASQRLKP